MMDSCCVIFHIVNLHDNAHSLSRRSGDAITISAEFSDGDVPFLGASVVADGIYTATIAPRSEA